MKSNTRGQNSQPVFSIVLMCLVATIGGFLFGFDSGVISGAVTALQKTFDSDAIGSGFNVSSMLLGCAVGAFFAGTLSNRFGRLPVLQVAAIFFLVSAWGSGAAGTAGLFIFYRCLGGLAVGAASVICPAYISEIAPAEYRGRLGSLQQMAIVLGLFLSFLSNYGMARLADGSMGELWLGFAAWQWMFWVEMIPAGVFFFLLFAIPESPRYLVSAGKIDRAMEVLAKLGHIQDARSKCLDIQDTLSRDRRPRLSDLVVESTGSLHPLVWIGIGIAALQQLSGINVIFYYGAVLWTSAGFEEMNALLQTAISGGLNVLSTIIAILLIDKVGRRRMLLAGSFGMSIFLGIVALVFSLAEVDEEGKLMLDALGGNIALYSANAYIACFAITWGPVMWVLLGEIFPNRMRASGIAIAGMTVWIANFFITMSFEGLVKVAGLGVAYWMYGFFAFISIGFVYRFIEETKGKTLEEMET